MSAWESFGSTYVEAASSALPLHRLLSVASGFIGSVAVANQTHLSIVESVSSISLSSLIELQSGPFAHATLANVFAGVGLAFIAWLGSRALLRAVFAVAARLTGHHKRVSEVMAASKAKLTVPLVDRQAMVALIDSALTRPQAQIRALNAGMEFSLALALGFITAIPCGNFLDFSLAICIFAVSVYLAYTSVRLFLSDYLGAAMLRAQLQGRRAPDPTEVD